VKSRCAGRRLRRLRGHGLWTRLGKKKKAGCKQFPGRLHDAISTEKTLAPAARVKRKKDRERKKKTWWEMRSRKSPEKVFCSKVVRQAFNFANNNLPSNHFLPPIHICLFTTTLRFLHRVCLEGVGSPHMWRSWCTQTPCYSVKTAHPRGSLRGELVRMRTPVPRVPKLPYARKRCARLMNAARYK
jgi:hypothetical protein